MMAKILCLTLIVFLIDFTYAAKIAPLIENNDQHVDDNSPMLPLTCGSNETLNNVGKVCEPTCDFSQPLFQCVEKTAPSCLCSNNYVRNKLNRCILFTDCSTEEFGVDELVLNTNVNEVQSGSLQENENTTLFDDNKILDRVVEYLTLKLENFLDSLNSRRKQNSGRNVRHTNITNSNDHNNYQAYEILLRESLGSSV